MISKCEKEDFETILAVINDGASAYNGIIPADRWHEPYMSEEELRIQISEGVEFWGYKESEEIIAVMGIQYKGEVTLIRHAYVCTTERKKGIGGKLLEHLRTIVSTPILIGTWSDAKWAIDFYSKHGFRLLTPVQTRKLLQTYWRIPDRQVETSVVLASNDWKENL
jgi:GNAT superfamily N-acetyltransferase